MQVFGKDLEKLFDEDEDCNIFLVVTRTDEDEFYHSDTLSKLDMSKLRH